MVNLHQQHQLPYEPGCAFGTAAHSFVAGSGAMLGIVERGGHRNQGDRQAQQMIFSAKMTHTAGPNTWPNDRMKPASPDSVNP